MFSNADREWEKFGRQDPYYGVITDDKHRMGNLTDEIKEEFFRSGKQFIEHVIEEIRKHIDPRFTPKHALDFGCGVGRLVIPLAAICEQVTGIDVSDSMLLEAQSNCRTRSLENVSLIKHTSSDKNLLSEKYDLMTAFVVFQHIPVKRGWRILENLLTHLKGDGVCVLHLTYAKKLENSVRSWIRRYIPLVKYPINLVKRRSLFYPVMEMNTYDLNKLFLILQKANVSELHAEYTDHGGELGVLVYFKKPAPEP